MSITFSGYGRVGDNVYSLWYVKQFSDRIKSKVNYHLQTNVKLPSATAIDRTHMNSTIFMTRDSAQFIKPFIEKCQFIEQVTIGDKKPQNAIELDRWRVPMINAYGGQLRQYFYHFDTLDLPREFWKPIVDVQADYRYKDKILLTLSQRYVNPLIDYKLLQKFKDLIVFTGTEKQFDIFNQKYFKLKQRYQPKDLLEVAQCIKGSLGYISNQTGFFTVAEAIKAKRILFPAQYMVWGGRSIPGPKNVLPLGGWCQNICNNNKLVVTIERMIGK